MNLTQKFFKIAIMVLFTASCSSESIESPDTGDDSSGIAKSLLNVGYGEDLAQKYDLFLPANRSGSITKVIVFIHGGGWIQGDKSDMDIYIPLLAEKHPDYAIVNLNYRLANLPTRAAFPYQFLDIQQALQHLEEESDSYGIKAEFGLIGVSAGAHLALQFDSVYDINDKVKFVCSIVGPTDFTDPFYKDNPDFNLALNFLIDENAYQGVTDFAKAVSPAFLVSEKSSATILFYGKEDPLVPLSNGIFLQNRLDGAGVENSLTIFNGGHGDWSDRANQNLQMELSSFIDLHLPLELN